MLRLRSCVNFTKYIKETIYYNKGCLHQKKIQDMGVSQITPYPAVFT